MEDTMKCSCCGLAHKSDTPQTVIREWWTCPKCGSHNFYEKPKKEEEYEGPDSAPLGLLFWNQFIH